jgi:hypothetical protein
MAAKAVNPKLYAEVLQKVKASVQKWPSAYASGMVVKEYKRLMAIRGEEPYITPRDPRKEYPLARWFKEKWIDLETGKPCGHSSKGSKVSKGSKGSQGSQGSQNSQDNPDSMYPTCRPTIRISTQTPRLASEFTENQIEKLIKSKQINREKNIKFKI